MALVVERCEGESVVIDGRIRIWLELKSSHRAKLIISAPREISITRFELLNEEQRARVNELAPAPASVLHKS